MALRVKATQESLSDNERWMITFAIETAVRAAEQSGIAGLIAQEADEKKQYAITVATRFLEQFNVTVDLDLLADLIEAEVGRAHDVFKRELAAPDGLPTPPA